MLANMRDVMKVFIVIMVVTKDSQHKKIRGGKFYKIGNNRLQKWLKILAKSVFFSI